MFWKKKRDETRTTRVARGMALLDQRRPGWHRNINLDRLDIASYTNCALGQTYGSYGHGRERLGFYGNDSRDHGFQISVHTTPIVGWKAEYNALTVEWRKQIEERLDTERAEWERQERARRAGRTNEVRRFLSRR
jgi:hypothetical protein